MDDISFLSRLLSGGNMKIKRIEDRCIGCMRCVDDCVSGVWQNINNVATVAAPEACNLCSHCIAVCPKKAIVHEGLDNKPDSAYYPQQD